MCLPLSIPNTETEGVFWKPVCAQTLPPPRRDPLAGHLLSTLVRTFPLLIVLSQDQSLADLSGPSTPFVGLPARPAPSGPQAS